MGCRQLTAAGLLQAERTSMFDRIIQVIGGQIEKQQDDNGCLAYWYALCASLAACTHPLACCATFFPKLSCFLLCALLPKAVDSCCVVAQLHDRALACLSPVQHVWACTHWLRKQVKW